MAKNKIDDYSLTPADNTDIEGIGILGTNNVRNFDDAFRTLMSHLAAMNKGTAPIEDAMRWCDPADETKIFRFDAGGVSTGTTRVFQVPDLAGTLAILNLAQTWTKKQTYTLGISLGAGNELAISDGGTGADNAADALAALGGVPDTRTITAGLGLIDGGDLASNITINMGTPGTIGNDTTNSTTGSSHFHQFDQTYAAVYTGSSASNISFPLGHTLICANAAVIDRNSNMNVYLNTDTRSYTSSPVGSQLNGTWRSRGYIGSDLYLVERTV